MTEWADRYSPNWTWTWESKKQKLKLNVKFQRNFHTIRVLYHKHFCYSGSTAAALEASRAFKEQTVHDGEEEQFLNCGANIIVCTCAWWFCLIQFFPSSLPPREEFLRKSTSLQSPFHTIGQSELMNFLTGCNPSFDKLVRANKVIVWNGCCCCFFFFFGCRSSFLCCCPFWCCKLNVNRFLRLHWRPSVPTSISSWECSNPLAPILVAWKKEAGPE